MKPPADDHFQIIYSGDQTALYDAMVSYEDVENNLLKTLQAHNPNLRHMVDIGAGTGRVSRLLAPYAETILSTDLNFAMLRQTQPTRAGWWRSLGDGTHLPVRSAWADLAVAGWAFGHFNGWFPHWRELVDEAVGEMRRICHPQGHQMIIETLGTGFEQPAPPTAGLAEYYAHLETQHGFQRITLRTDYVFPDVATGVKLVNFFFGAELADRLAQNQTVNLIEWTGVWIR